MQRGYLTGRLRAKRETKAQMHQMEDELEELAETVASLEGEVHRNRAIEEAEHEHSDGWRSKRMRSVK